MSTNKKSIPERDPLYSINLTEVERIRADAIRLRGELIAGAILSAYAAVGRLFGSIKAALGPKNPTRLGPTV
ncbi:MAG: hypothetical protein OEW79_06870 [Betaproteobacteria bacterium]|jgi:hypothetical protein|nr:hypothetical protein [Betaproteobacteria bacterium]